MMESDRISDRYSNNVSNNNIFRETEQNFLPLQVVDNFNQQLAQVKQEPNEQQVGDLAINTDLQRGNTAQLFIDKPKCLPIIQKKLSSQDKENDEIDEISQKQNRQMSFQNMESGSDVRSSQNKQGQQRQLMAKRTIRRMNSRIKARQSIILPRALNTSITTKISQLVESIPFSILMGIVTVYALFGDDIRILTVNKDGDDAFFVLTIICMFCFTLEIALTCITKHEYINNFYFWLDVISTATMFLDIGWITDEWYSGDITNASSIKTIGSASKVARKAARVIRVIRLVRLVKLYKHARQQIQKQQQKALLRQLLRQAQISQEEKIKKQQNEQLNQESQQQLQQLEILQQIKQQSQQNLSQSQNNQQHFNDEDRVLQIPNSKGIKGMIESDKIKKNPLNQSQISGNSIPQNQQIQKPVSSQDGSDGSNNQFSKSPGKSTPGKSGQHTNSQGDSLLNGDIDSKESKVGQQLSELVMRRVITVILSVLISIPLINFDTYEEKINSYDSGIFRISQFKDQQNVKEILISQYAQFHKGEIYPIQAVHILVNGAWVQYNYQKYPEYFESTSLEPDQYRFTDLQYYIQTSINGTLLAYSAADLVSYNQTNAILSIFQTIFVCIVLAISALLFNKDVEDMVIEPIETMMKHIELIAANPLEAVNIEEQEDLVIEELEKSQDHKKLKEKENEKTMETYILQRLIMKVGALLAVGFGEAGSEIIAENIKKGGGVDPMIPGKKIMAIFGFCDIRNFTDATEVLQQDVMVFVNEIAEIVHSAVNSFSGSANKNIGDAFLLVWKYEQLDYHPDPNNPSKLVLKDNKIIKQKGDMAVMAFLKIITSISISKKLEKYKKHPGLNARMKDYSVKMGFGLHMGWGIEGAIGSSFKIDASYLSPNVNMASRLEAATKQFGSIILISGILREYLTESCQKQLRLIDIVTVKGSIEPMKIFTIDLSIKNLLKGIKEPIDKYDVSKLQQREAKKYRVIQRFQRNQLMKNVEKDSIQIADLFMNDEELVLARSPFMKEFYDTWEQGFQYYINGQWDKALPIFNQTLTMIPEYKDGPSNTLLEVLHSNGNKAPTYWKGYRELTEK
ncbi:unnamed protein product [Paramecium sonneborni]|uniref:Guanylate cyclase domain-containing protein n=1 Tax=Paramecium sonneborni TaxID=65129 RepID=A0A8S1K1Q4_9CILI|nr:unnamed protein product [Paramecium sonneborni]